MGMVLGGGNPLRHMAVPYVNRALMAVCIATWLAGVPPETWSFVPAYVFGTPGVPGPLAGVNPWPGLLGHMFMHADVGHLVTNMVALWVFGDNVEDAMGHARFLLFYVLCAMAGAVTEAMVTTDPLVPLLGASGAISGVAGAYLLLHPHARILLLLFFRIPVLLPASLVVGLDLAANLAMAIHPLPPELGFADVAWGAHLGGFAAGVVLIVPFKRRDVPLLHPVASYPTVPFAWLQRLLIDVFPLPDPLGRRPTQWDHLMVAVKIAVYMILTAGLMHFF
jgi:membrane associated rhomboid family serine protease